MQWVRTSSSAPSEVEYELKKYGISNVLNKAEQLIKITKDVLRHGNNRIFLNKGDFGSNLFGQLIVEFSYSSANIIEILFLGDKYSVEIGFRNNKPFSIEYNNLCPNSSGLCQADITLWENTEFVESLHATYTCILNATLNRHIYFDKDGNFISKRHTTGDIHVNYKPLKMPEFIFQLGRVFTLPENIKDYENYSSRWN